MPRARAIITDAPYTGETGINWERVEAAGTTTTTDWGFGGDFIRLEAITDEVERLPEGRPPEKKFTARIAIAAWIKVWVFLAETGSRSETDFPRLDWARGNHLTLCEYTNRLYRRSGFRGMPCNYCPYKIFFGTTCSEKKDSPYHKWQHCIPRDKKKYAGLFLDELLQLQKAIITDPKSVLPQYKEK